MNYITTTQAGVKWGVSRRRVIILCQEGRVAGAQQAGRNWIIPEDAEKRERAERKTN